MRRHTSSTLETPRLGRRLLFARFDHPAPLLVPPCAVPDDDLRVRLARNHRRLGLPLALLRFRVGTPCAVDRGRQGFSLRGYPHRPRVDPCEIERAQLAAREGLELCRMKMRDDASMLLATMLRALQASCGCVPVTSGHGKYPRGLLDLLRAKLGEG
jgi:hypothetical protein